jgi:hypothetical protein
MEKMDEDEWKEYFRRLFKLHHKMIVLQIGQCVFGVLTALGVGALIFMLLLIGS